jgi:hypothetical protein
MGIVYEAKFLHNCTYFFKLTNFLYTIPQWREIDLFSVKLHKLYVYCTVFAMSCRSDRYEKFQIHNKAGRKGLVNRIPSCTRVEVFKTSALEARVMFYGLYNMALFGIRDILVRIRIRGSIPLTNGSRSRFFCLLLFEAIFTSFFKDKKSKNRRNEGFS